MNPLTGRRILITRAREQAGSLFSELQVLGAEVLVAPMIEIVPPDSYAPLDEALRNLASYDWLVVTSSNGAAALGRRMQALGVTPAQAKNVRVVAVGPATAFTLQKHGWSIHAMPTTYVAEAVVDVLGGAAAGKRVLLVRAKVARDVIPDALTKLGAQVDMVEAYQTVLPVDASQQLQGIFSDAARLPQVVTFTSSSTVKHFFYLLRTAGWARLPEGMVVASIGPITSQTLREHGVEPEIEAQEHSVPGLVAAIVECFGTEP